MPQQQQSERVPHWTEFVEITRKLLPDQTIGKSDEEVFSALAKRKPEILDRKISYLKENDRPAINWNERSMADLQAMIEQRKLETESRNALPETLGSVGGALATLNPVLAAARGGAALPSILNMSGRAALGGGAGAAVGDLINRITGKTTETSPAESAKNIGQEALVQGAGQLAGEGLFRGATKVWNKVFTQIDARKAGELMADELSKLKLSPDEFGSVVQKGFDEIHDVAGRNLRGVIEKTEQESPALQVKYSNLLNQIGKEINRFTSLKKDAPSLFAKTGEDVSPHQKVLDGLNELYKSVQGKAALTESPLKSNFPGTSSMEEHVGSQYFKARAFQSLRTAAGFEPREIAEEMAIPKTNLRDAADLRSTLFNIKKALPETASEGVFSRLTQAMHKDLTSAMSESQAARFEAASYRVHEIKDIAENKFFQSVFNPDKSKRLPPELVVNTLAKYPVESIRTLDTLYSGASPAVKDKVLGASREAILNKMMEDGSLPKVSDRVIKSVFPENSDQLIKFAQLLREAQETKGKVLGKVVDFMSTNVGGTRLAISDKAGNVVLLNPNKVAQLLSDPTNLKNAVFLAQQPLNEKGEIASQAAVTAWRALYAAINKMQEPQEPENKGFTILDQMRKKGIKVEIPKGVQ